VRRAGQLSWRIEIDEPEPLVIGLFVRDAAGLTTTHDWLPHAVPVIPQVDGEAPVEAARQWDLWWDRALQLDLDLEGQRQGQLGASWWTPPDFEALRSAPALQAVVASHFFDAVAWSRERKREHIDLMVGLPDPRSGRRERNGRGIVETRLVADLEHQLGRLARPFQLRITEIPVAGKQLWQLDPHHVLLTAGLLRDSDEYRRQITPVVQALL